MPGALPQLLPVPVGVAVEVQLPQLPVMELVAYAGGPITMAEPLDVMVLAVAVAVTDPENPEAVIVDVAPEEAQASFSRTEN